MSITDRELRDLLTSSAPVPRLGERDVLLESLVARVEAGGTDVVEAPMPSAVLTAVADDESEKGTEPEAATESERPIAAATSTRDETTEVTPLVPRRRWARVGAAAAGMSVAGWIAVGVGSAAAAAAGAWFLTHGFHDGGGDREDTVVIEQALEDGDAVETLGDVLVGHDALPTTAPAPVWGVTGRGASEASATPDTRDRDGAHDSTATSADDAGSTQDTSPPSAAGKDAGGGAASGSGMGTGGPASSGKPDDTDAPLVEADIDVPVVGGAAEGAKDAVDDTLGSVKDGVTGTVQDLEDTVVEIVPEGPLRDTVKPVIDAVNVSGLVATVLNSLICATDGAISVTASDDVGVDSVDLAIRVGGTTLIDIPLSPGSGDRWTGALSPLSSLDLGLDRVVDVTVVATDAAGNSATKVTQKTVKILSCLG